MEIERFRLLYRKHSPKEFFDWASQGRTMELRFLSDRFGNKFKDWHIIMKLAGEVKAEFRFNSIYVDSWEQVKKVLTFRIKGIPATRLYNIFVSVNPRRKVYVKSKSGLLYQSYYGGIAGTEYVQNVLADIEHIGERKGNATEIMLEECINGAKYLVDYYELKDYYINISGNGVHLWFRLEQPIELPVPTFVEYETKVKYNLKEDPIYTEIKTYNRFIEKLDKVLQEYNPKLKVDEGAKDLSRIARLPGSWNVKAGKKPRCCGTVKKENKINNNINQNYASAKPNNNKLVKNLRKTAKRSRKYRYNHLNIRECPLVQLLLSGYLPSNLSRNHYLEQSFAKILADNGMCPDDIPELISEIDIIQRKAIQVDPEYLDSDEPFNSEMVNSYCIACKIDLYYPILEDIPEVADNLISEKKYDTWNKYSETTINLSAKKDYTKPRDYMELKKLIRDLVDKYDKMSAFFTIKKLYLDEWDYYHRNKIIFQLLNKTRKRIK
jgi:hypothetical protein